MSLPRGRRTASPARRRSVLPLLRFVLWSVGLWVGLSRSVTAGVSAGASAGASTGASGTDRAPEDHVVLLHGLGRSSLALAILRYRLHRAGFETHSVVYNSLTEEPAGIVADVIAEMDDCCREVPRGARIHFVGHSLGGLIIRAYLARRRPANLGRVVLLGTPNQGSAVADYVSRWRLSEYLPTVRALGTGADGLARQLPVPDYEVGVIAGDRSRSSAFDEILGDAHDGMVSVDSTRLEDMRDFIVMPVTHVGMRNDEAVADQVIAFLRTGRFLR
ncbi:MAG: alpha/beta fold hydrolase [Burkholderiales bacterium]|nr:MAG: alpha/beta fold hydrolase [Burkholderiales bacterium]